jgi:hypothetical protein
VGGSVPARQTTGRSGAPPAQPRSVRLAVLLIVGALASACAAPPTAPVHDALAKLEKVDGAVRVVLVAKAVERIGIKTAAVETLVAGGVRRTSIPYGALIYDTKGEAFAYTNPAPLTFVRHSLRVAAIQGDRVILTEGPAAGASVVTVGASQLLGIELGVGL